MNFYQTMNLDKSMYKVANKSFTQVLEDMDSSKNYKGTDLEGLDAYQRQLKRFDIKVSGFDSDIVDKFFQTADSTALFPEYIARAVRQGMVEANPIKDIVATTTKIDSLDYRTITCVMTDDDKELKPVAEGSQIPETVIRTKDSLVSLNKLGRMLVASYEAIRYQKLDIFTVALKQIGSHMAKTQLKMAIDILLNGDEGTEPAKEISLATAGVVTYKDLLNLWSEMNPYEMNTLLVPKHLLVKLLNIDEMKDPMTGMNFQGTGKLVTPIGANILVYENEGATDKIIALDKRYALEMVVADEITVDYDKIIDRQLERAAITSTVGFSKIIDDATVVLG